MGGGLMHHGEKASRWRWESLKKNKRERKLQGAKEILEKKKEASSWEGSTFKEALDNFSLIPQFFFFKKVEIFIPLEVYTYVIDACSLLLATSIQLQRYKDFSFGSHFKKSTSINTNTVAYETLWRWC